MKSIEILRDLVGIDTIADKNNKQIMDYVGKFFQDLGFTINRMVNKGNGNEVLIATYGDDPAIGFLGHTDTVDVAEGWVTDPHQLIEKDGNLYGLGACDMKGGMAAFMAAIAELDLTKLKRGISIYCTYDEEIMFGGIEDLIKANVEFPDHVIVAEPTDLIPMIGSKGLLEYVFTFNGVATHSSTPIHGKSSNKNAVRFLNKMMDFEEELRKTTDPFFGVPYSTMNIGIIEGGIAINTVPDKTTVHLDFRICDYDREAPLMKQAVDDAIKGLDGEYEIINDIPSFQNRSDLIDFYEAKTGKKAEPCSGITEASFFKGDKIIIGPGPNTDHEANEHISKESLVETTALYKEVIEKLCF